MAKKQITPLSKRELQVLRQIWYEKSNAEIGKKLKITEHGVDFHRKNIYRKTKCRNVVGLMKYALKSGIVSI